ncbi:hypothetical protein [Arthrobacter sp. PAMC25284]|uniref:hypothetical protein n=1 Tax=Arthrobacter sp. PAMC25284 TaxID=2861279 RepID=UPI001C631C05|nr:hypothetical protein [Arthrobacter sp. PAMC25284]QYF89917.1 hypothetical protein KY499_00455 [Arthrobacter sp. PAMC25284]
MAEFDSSPGKADSPPPNDPAPAGSTKRRRILVAAAIAAVVAAAAVVIPLTLGAPEPAPSSPASSAPVSTQSAEAGPPVTYYDQPGPPEGSPLEQVEALKVDVSKDLVGTSLTKGIAGISLEATDLADADLSSSNASMVKLLQEIDQPVLRFGGNAVDRRFFWTSTGEPLPYSGDKTHPARAVGPADLSRINTLLEAGDAKIALTVDLGHYNPDRAADMAKQAAEIFGDRLLSITVGNEPNGYVFNGVRTNGYSLEQYITELKAYAQAIHAVAPNVPIAGPGAYDQKWWQPFIDAEIPQKKILSFHNYPLYSCDGSDPKGSPTMANLMSQLMHDRAADYQQAALAAGKGRGAGDLAAGNGNRGLPGLERNVPHPRLGPVDCRLRPERRAAGDHKDRISQLHVHLQGRPAHVRDLQRRGLPAGQRSDVRPGQLLRDLHGRRAQRRKVPETEALRRRSGLHLRPPARGRQHNRCPRQREQPGDGRPDRRHPETARQGRDRDHDAAQRSQLCGRG